MQKLIFATFVLSLQAFAGDALEPWASKSQPSDSAKQHVQEITKNQQQYTVVQGGTVDGENCRSPLGCGLSREGVLEQPWESNRSVRLENIGEIDVVNPWLSNNRNTFRNLGEIVTTAIQPGMKENEKAMALWFQEIQHRYHFGGDNNEVGDPVKVFNVYGHNTCGNDSICMAGLMKKAGLKVAPARAVGHCISQAFYDGHWHMLDGDQHAVYLLRDNETIAGDQDIARDHDLVARTHTQGILFGDDALSEQYESSLFVDEGEVNGDRNSKLDTSMNMTLRPGEAITWRWGHLNPIKFHGSKPIYPDTICNGLWEYRPDFSKEAWKKGALSVEGVVSSDGALKTEPGKSGTIIWSIRTPYVLLGGRIEAEPAGAKFSISTDGKNWQDASENLDKFFPSGGNACYEYQLKCTLATDGQLKHLRIVNDLQMALLSLPSMRIGENAFVYSDGSPNDRKVRITHEWVERSSSKPPQAPPGAIFPPDNGDCDGTDIAFQWKPADGDGSKIDDYQFELANRQDMKWPLSMSFYKLISRTADKGKTQYTLPSAGLLSNDRKYYWHVRAKNDKGVWGPWSKTWSFTVHAPAYPLDVVVDFDKDKGVGTLRWKPNPAGRPPKKYRVYASDLKGFSISDVPYAVNVGSSKEVPSQSTANFVAETTSTDLLVLGAEGAANKTYYRVVAVDEQSKRSGPSDFATAPRPVIFSKPVTTAKSGSAYKYCVTANRSLGDLKLRQVDGHEVAGFWEIERPKFALQKGPAWLKIDATGVLSGTPDAAGTAEVSVTVTIDHELRKLDEGTLRWGNEKVLSTTTERVGSAAQNFTIEVAP